MVYTPIPRFSIKFFLNKGEIAWEYGLLNSLAAILVSPKHWAFTWSYRSSIYSFVDVTLILYNLNCR